MRVTMLCGLAVALMAHSAAGLSLTECTEAGLCDVNEGMTEVPDFGFTVSGKITVDVLAPCSSVNGGEVAVALYVSGETYTATGALWQKDGCGLDGSPVWTLSAAFDLGVVVRGITLNGASIVLVRDEDAWTGTVSGTASNLFGGAGGEGAVVLTADFSAEAGLTALRGDVTLAGDGVSFSGTVATDGTTSTEGAAGGRVCGGAGVVDVHPRNKGVCGAWVCGGCAGGWDGDTVVCGGDTGEGGRWGMEREREWDCSAVRGDCGGVDGVCGREACGAGSVDDVCDRKRAAERVTGVRLRAGGHVRNVDRDVWRGAEDVWGGGACL